MPTTSAVTQNLEKPGRLLLAIMAWQRQLAAQQKARSTLEVSAR
jgi:hypothetical protein